MQKISLYIIPVIAALTACSGANEDQRQSIKTKQDVDDQRTVIELTSAQRAHVLGEMNQFFASTQGVIDGLVENDPDLVQGAVFDAVDHGQGGGEGQGLMAGALPPEFRQMGSDMRVEFRKISQLSKAEAAEAEILEQLSVTMNYCQSCHMSYQIRVSNQED